LANPRSTKSVSANIVCKIRSYDIDDPGELSHLQKQHCEAVEAILSQSVHQLCESHTFVSLKPPYVEILKPLVQLPWWRSKACGDRMKTVPKGTD
jgi:hypothetical protein